MVTLIEEGLKMGKVGCTAAAHTYSVHFTNKEKEKTKLKTQATSYLSIRGCTLLTLSKLNTIQLKG